MAHGGYRGYCKPWAIVYCETEKEQSIYNKSPEARKSKQVIKYVLSRHNEAEEAREALRQASDEYGGKVALVMGRSVKGIRKIHPHNLAALPKRNARSKSKLVVRNRLSIKEGRTATM